MPAKDKYHDTVIHALQKDGWRIVKDNVLLSIARRHIWIDLKIERGEQTHYVEIKGFETDYSVVDYLSNTIGQCVLYQAAIERLSLPNALYLAVPDVAYEGILSEPIGRAGIQKAAINLVTFDVDREAILRWTR